MSLGMRGAVGVLSLMNRVQRQTTNKAQRLAVIKVNQKPADLPHSMYEKYGSYFRRVNGANVIHLDPESAKYPNVLIFVHGGAYKTPMTLMHWGIVDRLMKATSASALVPQYPLPPDHTASNTFAILDQVFAFAQQGTTRKGGKIIIAGDCAGGGIVQGYIMSRRDRDLITAPHVLLFSPWLDATLANPEINSIKDPLLNCEELRESGKLWAGAWGVKDPRVSPIYGTFENLPNTLIFQGKRDLMYPDVRQFASLAVGAGSPVKLTVAPSGFHTYVGTHYLPESRAAYKDISLMVTGVS